MERIVLVSVEFRRLRAAQSALQVFHSLPQMDNTFASLLITGPESIF